MNGRVFNVFIEAAGFTVICHQRYQHADALSFTFRSQRFQQRLGDLAVMFAFKDAYPVEIRAEKGGVASAADERGVNPADDLTVLYGDKGHGGIEARIVKAHFQLPCVCLVRLPKIGIRLLPSQFYFKIYDLLNVTFFKSFYFKYRSTSNSNVRKSTAADGQNMYDGSRAARLGSRNN